MKIAVSASGNTLESLIDPLFGRCPYFIVVDPERMSFEAFENPNVTVNDAGIKSARFVASKGAEIVVTGNCGPKAVQKLSEEGIKIIVGLMGTIRQVVETYKKGNLLTTADANVEEYFGKRHENTMGKDKNQSQEDAENVSSNTPWFGYVRLNQKEGPNSSE
ncbi:MAG: NifB/NifX family molybdenum-iron cluster-binding protein [Deltaproteobacteria bacterium]|nr:NifB/NifX family molybdenum-iron cluster-binding protein [Deltaproteobacteria bacterium]